MPRKQKEHQWESRYLHYIEKCNARTQNNNTQIKLVHKPTTYTIKNSMP